MALPRKFAALHRALLSAQTKKRAERAVLGIAIAGFLVHLALIGAVEVGLLVVPAPTELLRNPIAAIYTPFSFILVYEVYLLVYYLPRSITTYVGKQYEIITLILIRHSFKDLAALSLTADWFTSPHDRQFTYDLAASALLFFLLYVFYRQDRHRRARPRARPVGVARFVAVKKALATALVPVLLALAGYSFVHWLAGALRPAAAAHAAFQDINNIFFEQFFAVLIVADVLLLLLSFFHTDEFHAVVRNSGFVISTILIRLSFSVSGLLNPALIVAAVVFGLVIRVIHDQFERHLGPDAASASPFRDAPLGVAHESGGVKPPEDAPDGTVHL
ncbi:hypothetical protein [Hymenobacter terricola]|uniref:hypothetical protein n=1 Tax=Hymenobacter terricola TaxID=2819236 RepID=UPI001B302FEA|nr:hypothetical protein [Hymenobacter terricola]